MGTNVRVAALKKVLFPAFGFPIIPTCTCQPRGELSQRDPGDAEACAPHAITDVNRDQKRRDLLHGS